MKVKCRVGDDNRLYVIEPLRDILHGDVEALANAKTITFFKPDEDPEVIKKSLKIVLQDLELRIQEKKRKEAQQNE